MSNPVVDPASGLPIGPEVSPHAAPRPQRVYAPEVDFQHVGVQEEESVQGLVLRAGADVVGDGKMGQELLDLGCSQVARVAFVVKEDESSDPVDEAFAWAGLAETGLGRLVEQVEQARGWSGGWAR